MSNSSKACSKSLESIKFGEVCVKFQNWYNAEQIKKGICFGHTYISTFKMSIYGWRLDAGMESSQVFGTWITILRLVLSFLIENTTMQFSSYCQH